MSIQMVTHYEGLACMTRTTVPTPMCISLAILSMDKPDSRNRNTSPRSKIRFGRPMALPLFVPCRRPRAHIRLAKLRGSETRTTIRTDSLYQSSETRQGPAIRLWRCRRLIGLLDVRSAPSWRPPVPRFCHKDRACSAACTQPNFFQGPLHARRPRCRIAGGTGSWRER